MNVVNSDAAPIQTVAVIVFDAGKVLLVKHLEKADHVNGIYGLPAGRVEEGESLLKAAVREFFEETGLETSEDSLLPLPHEYEAKIERKDGSSAFFSMSSFLCNKFSGSLKGGSETYPEWVELKKIPTLPLLPNVSKAVEEASKM